MESLFPNFSSDESSKNSPKGIEPAKIETQISPNNSSKSFKELLQSVELDNEDPIIEEQAPIEEYDRDFSYNNTYSSNYSTPNYKLDPDFLDGMNNEQKEAVLYHEGSLLVLAGAGSGKTRVITHRFAYLIDKYQLRLNNILCVTFTNKAAGEMKERISGLLGVSTKTAWIRTFHSMCAMILREHCVRLGFNQDFTIYDSGDTKNSIKKIMVALKIDPNIYDPKIFNEKTFASKIFSAKEDLITPQDMKKSARSDFDDMCADVYLAYQNTLKQNQAMDFGDLIGHTITLLEQNSDIQERYQRQWRYIMADEFQDTNTPQYRLLCLLSKDKKNVCVVGDDDQSIYGWRGAKVENIRQFHDEFKAHTIRLEKNYRSHGNILTAANSVVKSIKGRMPKTLQAVRQDGNKILYSVLSDDREQAAYVYEEIRKRLNNGASYKDFAVLYRTNAQSRVLEEVFTRHRIPHKIYGGQRFYDRAEIKDILSYLRIMINPQDTEAFDRIVNVPKRKIGDVGKQKIFNYVQMSGLSFSETCLQAEHIEGLNKQAEYNLIQLGKVLTELKDSISNYPPTEIVKILIESIRYYDDYLVAEYGSHEADDRFENIQELVNAIRVFEQANPGATIADFLREASLLSTIDEGEAEDQDNVISLMTIHSSKGLEFPIVFLIGVAEGVLPLQRGGETLSEDDMNEEKRLMYVAITRAMDQLYITYGESSQYFGNYKANEKSTFIDAIPTEILSEVTQKKSSSMSYDNYTKRSRYSGKNFTSSKMTVKTMPAAQHRAEMQAALETDDLSLPTKTEAVKSISDLEIGTKVVHMMFGQGEVEYMSSAMIKVGFKKFGTQVLMGNAIMNLKKIVE